LFWYLFEVTGNEKLFFGRITKEAKQQATIGNKKRGFFLEESLFNLLHHVFNDQEK